MYKCGGGDCGTRQQDYTQGERTKILSLYVPQNQVTCEQRPWLWLVSFFPAPAADAHMAKAEYHFRVSAK